MYHLKKKKKSSNQKKKKKVFFVVYFFFLLLFFSFKKQLPSESGDHGEHPSIGSQLSLHQTLHGALLLPETRLLRRSYNGKRKQESLTGPQRMRVGTAVSLIRLWVLYGCDGLFLYLIPTRGQTGGVDEERGQKNVCGNRRD